MRRPEVLVYHDMEVLATSLCKRCLPSTILPVSSKAPLARRDAQRIRGNAALGVHEMQYPSEEHIALLHHIPRERAIHRNIHPESI